MAIEGCLFPSCYAEGSRTWLANPDLEGRDQHPGKMPEVPCVEVVGEKGLKWNNRPQAPDISPTRKGCSVNASVTLGMIFPGKHQNTARIPTIKLFYLINCAMFLLPDISIFLKF